MVMLKAVPVARLGDSLLSPGGETPPSTAGKMQQDACRYIQQRHSRFRAG